MPTVRTSCPSCDVVTISAPELMVRLHEASSTRSEAVFVCPECATVVVHPLNERMVPVLLGAGCPVDRVRERQPSPASITEGADPFQPELSELEIQCFRAALDRSGWFDELVH